MSTPNTASAPPRAPDAPGVPAERTPSVTHRAEYAAFRVVVGALGVLPRGLIRALGGALGTLGYRVGIRRRVTEHQIAAAYPELSTADHHRMAAGAYANLGRIALEAGTMSKLPKQALLDAFHEPVGWEYLEPHLVAKRGVILISGHFGNWELGLSWLAARGVPLVAVAREFGNPLFGSFVIRARKRLGWGVITDREAVKKLPRALADGQVVAMLSDQGAKGMAATFAPFFGRPARTPRGPAVMSRRLGAPCVFAVMPLEPDGKYRVYLEPADVIDTGNKDADVQAMVESYTRQLEKWVRKYPEQYLWQHRRWRRRPDGTVEDV